MLTMGTHILILSTIFIRECHIRIMLRVFMDITDFSLRFQWNLFMVISKPLLPWLPELEPLHISVHFLSWNCWSKAVC